MPVITIARGTLGTATQLAARLSELLGCPAVSREEVYEAARAYGIHETGLGDPGFLDQRPPSFWHPYSDSRRRYLACFQVALMDRALAGDLIYVGHMAHLLLSGYRRVLRVRLAAPDAFRVEMLVQSRGMTEAQAVAYIREVDERRLRWSQFLYGVDWRNPDLYDLVLNPEKVRLETMAKAVEGIARSLEMQPTAYDREQLRNQRLSAVCRAALLRSARTRGLELGVEGDAASGHVRVYGAPPAVGIIGSETWQRDVRSVLHDVEGVLAVDVVAREPPAAPAE